MTFQNHLFQSTSTANAIDKFSSKTFTDATSVTVSHSFARVANAWVVNSEGSEVEVQEDYSVEGQVTFSWNGNMSGTAYVN